MAAPLRPGGAPGSCGGDDAVGNWPRSVPLPRGELPVQLEDRPCALGGLDPEPRVRRGGPGFLLEELGAGCWVPTGRKGRFAGAGRAGGDVAWSCGVPSLSGLHLGALRSRIVPVHALPRWGQVPPSGGCCCAERSGPKQDGHPLSVAAASSRCRHERAQPPREAGPVRVWTAGASVALRLGG